MTALPREAGASGCSEIIGVPMGDERADDVLLELGLVVGGGRGGGGYGAVLALELGEHDVDGGLVVAQGLLRIIGELGEVEVCGRRRGSGCVWVGRDEGFERLRGTG